jgi:predicted esterase
MIHGRNAAPRNILDVARALDRPRFTYLAPAAANNTWYPFSFKEQMERNEPGLSSSLEMLRALVDTVIAKGIRREHVVLLGFSQGACLTSEFAVRNASRYGGVIAYSGGVIGPPGTQWNNPGSFDGMPAFFGCSDVDAHIPKERVDESAAVFTRMGALVTERLYPGMGHTVNEDELEFARDLMDRILADST